MIVGLVAIPLAVATLFVLYMDVARNALLLPQNGPPEQQEER